MSCLFEDFKKRNEVFKAVHQGVDAQRASDDERKEKNLNSQMEFTYGEVLFEHFVAVLEYADPQPGEVFWDLGCGAGRPLVTASLAFPEL